MVAALIGCTGFVGSNLAGSRPFEAQFHRADIEEIRGQEFDEVVCAGMPAAKWLANREPSADAANTDLLIACLQQVRARRFTLISTVDVYPRPAGVDEDTPIDEEDLHAYGFNRLRLERFVQGVFPDALVVRLPALFGPGLKKNALYDLLHNNNLGQLNKDDEFQWYDVSRLADDIEVFRARGLRLINVAAQPVRLEQIRASWFAGANVPVQPRPPVRYDMRTRHADVFGRSDGYLVGQDETLQAIGRFLAREKAWPAG